MKQPKKPTYNNKKVIGKYNLDPREWAVVNETTVSLEIINKRSGARRVLDK